MSNKIFEVMGRRLIHTNANKASDTELKCKVEFNKYLYGKVYKAGVCVYYNKKNKPFVAELIDDYDVWIKAFDANYVNYLQVLGNRTSKPWIKNSIRIVKLTKKDRYETEQRDNDSIEEFRTNKQQHINQARK